MKLIKILLLTSFITFCSSNPTYLFGGYSEPNLLSTLKDTDFKTALSNLGHILKEPVDKMVVLKVQRQIVNGLNYDLVIALNGDIYHFVYYTGPVSNMNGDNAEVTKNEKYKETLVDKNLLVKAVKQTLSKQNALVEVHDCSSFLLNESQVASCHATITFTASGKIASSIAFLIKEGENFSLVRLVTDN